MQVEVMLCLKHIMLAAVVLNCVTAVANLVGGNLQWAIFNMIIACFCQIGYLQEANKE